MSAKANGHLTNVNWQVWIWGIIYPVLNIGLIAMHYWLSPAMYAWTRQAPLPLNAIDSVKPWAQPEDPGFIVAKAEVADAEVAVEEAVDEEADLNEDADADFE